MTPLKEKGLDLAQLVLDLDARYPGDEDAPMELPAELWAALVEKARAVREAANPR